MTGMTGMTGMARDDRDGRDGWGVAVMHMGVAMMLKMTTTLYAWDLNPSHTMSVELSRGKRPPTGLAHHKRPWSVCSRERDCALLARRLMRVRDGYG